MIDSFSMLKALDWISSTEGWDRDPESHSEGKVTAIRLVFWGQVFTGGWQTA